MRHFLNTEQLAATYPALFSVSGLRKSRMRYTQMEGPPFLKLGKKVAYDDAVVEAWTKTRERQPSPVDDPPELAPILKRYRPTKAQQIANRRAACRSVLAYALDADVRGATSAVCFNFRVATTPLTYGRPYPARYRSFRTAYRSGTPGASA